MIGHNLKIIPIAAFLALTWCCMAGTKVSKYEKYLANSAAYLGTDLLAKDPSDETGTTLVAAALKLDPDNERALLTSMKVKKELELTPKKHPYTADDFVKKAAVRGKSLYDKGGEYTGAKTLAMLYFSTAERLKKDDETVLIYLEKLQRDEDIPELADILAADETSVDWLEKKAEVAAEAKPEDTVPFWGVNQPVADLTRLYGKTVRTKYAPQSNGTLKYFTTPNGQIETFISGGKCVRVQFSIPRREYPTAADRDAFVMKDRPGWGVVLEKPTVRGYENADKTMAASITEAGSNLTFVAWSKAFYK